MLLCNITSRSSGPLLVGGLLSFRGGSPTRYAATRSPECLGVFRCPLICIGDACGDDWWWYVPTRLMTKSDKGIQICERLEPRFDVVSSSCDVNAITSRVNYMFYNTITCEWKVTDSVVTPFGNVFNIEEFHKLRYESVIERETEQNTWSRHEIMLENESSELQDHYS